jgi:Gas vesicle synthesis protein GvpL/GvpF
VIYAYGICEPGVAAAALCRRGLGGATLRALDRAGLAAVYSRHRSLRPRPIPELVLEHERVVEGIMARGAVLPLRFGTELASEQQLAAVLAERHDELLRSLDRVRGKAEIGIRMIATRSASGDPAIDPSGRDYLLARVQEHRRSQQAIDEVHAGLAALSRASRIRQPPRPASRFAAAYLVDAERVAEFRRQADRLAQRQAGMQLIVTGPWPPYTFAAQEQG